MLEVSEGGRRISCSKSKPMMVFHEASISSSLKSFSSVPAVLGWKDENLVAGLEKRGGLPDSDEIAHEVAVDCFGGVGHVDDSFAFFEVGLKGMWKCQFRLLYGEMDEE